MPKLSQTPPQHVRASGWTCASRLRVRSYISIRDARFETTESGPTEATNPGLIAVTDPVEALGDHREISSPDGRGTPPVRQSRSKPTDQQPYPPTGSARVEEGDHRQHPAVIVAGLREAQLDEDAAHVLLYGGLSDPQPAGNTGVGPSFRHQRQHVPFPRAEHTPRIVTTTSRAQFLHQRRVPDRSPIRHPL